MNLGPRRDRAGHPDGSANRRNCRWLTAWMSPTHGRAPWVRRIASARICHTCSTPPSCSPTRPCCAALPVTTAAPANGGVLRRQRSPAMARTVEASGPADRPMSGLVVTSDGHGVGPLPRIEVIKAAHAVPDAAGVMAAAQMLDAVATYPSKIWCSVSFPAVAPRCSRSRFRKLPCPTSRRSTVHC